MDKKSLLTKYQHLEDEIKKKEELQSQIFQHQKVLADLKETLDEKKKILHQIRGNEIFDHKEITQLKSVTFKSIWESIKGERKSHLETLQQDYLKLKHEEETLQIRVDSVQIQYDTTHQEYLDLLKQKTRLDTLYTEMNELLFSSKFLKVNDDLEKETFAAGCRLEEIRKFKLKFEKCLFELRTAKSDFENAGILLKDANSLSYELYSPFFFPDYFVESYIHSDIGKASNYLNNGQYHLKTAKAFEPTGLPQFEIYINTRTYSLYDGFFDGFYSELSINESLNQKRFQIKNGIVLIQSAIMYVEQVLKAVLHDFQSQGNKYSTLKENIIQERLKTLKQESDVEKAPVNPLYQEFPNTETYDINNFF